MSILAGHGRRQLSTSTVSTVGSADITWDVSNHCGPIAITLNPTAFAGTLAMKASLDGSTYVGVAMTSPTAGTAGATGDISWLGASPLGSAVAYVTTYRIPWQSFRISCDAGAGTAAFVMSAGVI